VGKAIGNRTADGSDRAREVHARAASSAAPATHIMRTDTNAPAKQARRFMGTLSLNGRWFHPALWQKFENLPSPRDHSRVTPRRQEPIL